MSDTPAYSRMDAATFTTYRILELREALHVVAEFLESAATYQDRPGAMAEHEAMAAQIREVLVPPSVKVARAAKEKP